MNEYEGKHVFIPKLKNLHHVETLVLGLRDYIANVGWGDSSKVGVDGRGGHAKSLWFFATLTIHDGIAGYQGINLSHKIHRIFDIPVINTWNEPA